MNMSVVRAACVTALLLGSSIGAHCAEWLSHPPMRPLPVASARPMPKDAVRYVDTAKGLDTNSGTLEQPWKTLQHAASQLHPGDTLSLRAGTYYERPNLARIAGTPEKPVTIRAQQGELVVIDGGYREFAETPATAWEPCPDGVPGEYRSTKTYETGGGYGNFLDSMVPLHRYISIFDLRSQNELWDPEFGDRAHVERGIYCGPGARRDEDGRIHIRLAHHQLAGLGDHAYRGETDPRKVPLVITGGDYTLSLQNCQHLHLQDLVIRGSKMAAMHMENADGIVLDGVTLYGGMMALRTGKIGALRVVDSAFRGHAAPWHSRAHHKYRAGAGYLVLPIGRDFEFERCEFTDNHDFIALEQVENVRCHHCYIDNFNDDGVEPGPKRAAGQILFYQNYFSRCLSPFTAHAKKKTPVDAEPGSGVYIYRNVLDFRRGIYRTPPTQPDPTGAYLDSLTDILAHDHGSPIHPIYYFYQNTVLMREGGWRGYYAFTMGAHTAGTTRRVFNNIFAQVEKAPGLNFTAMSPADDFQADHNLFWSLSAAAPEKRPYPKGIGEHDQFAEPRFAAWSADTSQPLDVRLTATSSAIRAGNALPLEWPDPLRAAGSTRPDLGALPAGARPWGVGIHERIPVFPHAPEDGSAK
jgi:hypothetical protein